MVQTGLLMAGTNARFATPLQTPGLAVFEFVIASLPYILQQLIPERTRYDSSDKRFRTPSLQASTIQKFGAQSR